MGDVYALDYPDDSFDVVHAHMVLQHLSEPVAAIVEMRRVLRPGGILAVRDSDYATFVWAPADPVLTRWLDTYHEVCRRNGAEPDAGRYLLGWCHAGGFADVTMTADVMCYAEPDGRAFWGGGWAQRALSSSFATQALDHGLATAADLQAMTRPFSAGPNTLMARGCTASAKPSLARVEGGDDQRRGTTSNRSGI